MEKTTENKIRNLRRAAEKQGLYIRSSRASYSINNQGGYQIIDQNNTILAGERFDMTVEDVENFINQN